MSHIYSNQFFDYIDKGARRSAQSMIRCLHSWITPESVVDFGCGRGAWLAEWSEAGCHVVVGVDGDYVDRQRLLIPEGSFVPADLCKSIDLGRRFSLAQSLEVGEHLPTEASSSLVDSLTAHSDLVLFSAAVPGQGGEFHINEQPLVFWQRLFAERGFSAYDCLRPEVVQDADIEPWYRYNTVLYVNASGANTLPEEVLKTKVEDGALDEVGSFGWAIRKFVVRQLPQKTVTAMAQARAKMLVRLNRAK